MKKTINIIYSVMFLMIVLIPLLLTNREEGVISEIDNRELLEAPKFGETGYAKDFEKYLQDRIGLRNQMVNYYAVLNDIIADELTHPTYTYGQDGYIFFNMHGNIPYNDFHKTFAEMVLELQTYSESRGSKFYFMFEPEKISVLREYLPKGVNYDNSWVDEMLYYMDELGVNYVSNEGLLIEKSKNEVVFNRQFDAGHWNDLGSFYSTNNLLNRIHSDIPTVTELTKEEFNITTETARQLPVSEFRINEEIPSFKLKTDYKDITAEYMDYVETDSRYPYFHHYINKADGAEELPKTLFFQGSYYNRGPQFLVSRTSEYIGVHNYQNVLNLDYYYNIFQPELVILEVAEYTFLDRYFDTNKMQVLDFNPAIINYSSSVSFEEQVEELKRNATLFTVNADIDLIESDKVDTIILNRKFSEARYSYLITDDLVIDLKTNDEGNLYANLLHGEIADGDDVTVYIEDYDGKKFYVPLRAKSVELFTDELVASEGTKISEDTYTLTTNIKDNKFDQIVLQLYNSETSEYISALHSTDKVGTVNGMYTHNKEDGWYIIRLKVNSNLKDEYVECKGYLGNGLTYYYSFSVDDLSEQEASLSNFRVYGYSGINN